VSRSSSVQGPGRWGVAVGRPVRQRKPSCSLAKCGKPSFYQYLLGQCFVRYSEGIAYAWELREDSRVQRNNGYSPRTFVSGRVRDVEAPVILMTTSSHRRDDLWRNVLLCLPSRIPPRSSHPPGDRGIFLSENLGEDGFGPAGQPALVDGIERFVGMLGDHRGGSALEDRFEMMLWVRLSPRVCCTWRAATARSCRVPSPTTSASRCQSTVDQNWRLVRKRCGLTTMGTNWPHESAQTWTSRE